MLNLYQENLNVRIGISLHFHVIILMIIKALILFISIICRQEYCLSLCFPSKMDFYNDGILLNDVTRFTPTKTFRINICSLIDSV